MFLLDTCALLWLVMEPGKLSARARALILANREELAVSAISAFEIAIKARKGKLDLPLPPEEWWRTALAHHGIVCVPISDEIALASAMLPPHHNDPADRIILATARVYMAPVLTNDEAFRAYDSVQVEW